MLAPLLLTGSLLSGLGITPEMIAERGLQAVTEARATVVVETDIGGREFRLTRETAEAWLNMKAHATEDGVDLVIVSAFRSVQAQANIIQRKLDAGMAIEEILMVNAPPGYSQHHTGLALDIGAPGATDLRPNFDQTEAFRWLVRYAHHFGFMMPYGKENTVGFDYEPWHWIYVWS